MFLRIPLQRGGIRQFRLWRRGERLRRGLLRKGFQRRGGAGRILAHFDRFKRRGKRSRCGANRAQIAFDRRQAIDHVAERAVNGLERVLRAAVGFRLAEADVGQFALDQIDDAGVHRLGGVGRIAVGVGERDQAGVLAFERTQNIVQPFLDPSEVDGGRGGTIAGGFQALQQIGYALFEMGKRRGIVVAGRDAIEPLRQRAQRVFEIFRIVARGRRLPCFQRRGQRGQALLEHAEGIAVAVKAGKLIDLGRQRVHVVGEPRQRVVGGDVGDDAAQRRDRAFELLHGRRDRRSNAGSDRAWRRDCGSPRRSR